MSPNLSDSVLIKVAIIFRQIELRKIAVIPHGISKSFTTSRCQRDADINKRESLRLGVNKN